MRRKNGGLMKKILFIFSIFFIFTSCTVSVTLTDTHGVSDDVVDTNASAEADVQAEANVPVTPVI